MRQTLTKMKKGARADGVATTILKPTRMLRNITLKQTQNQQHKFLHGTVINYVATVVGKESYLRVAFARFALNLHANIQP